MMNETVQTMNYPADMTLEEIMEFEYTQEEIMEFEYNYNRYLDTMMGVGQYWEENALLQIVAQELRELI